MSKSSRPLVSVVMNVYNGERFLSEAIESILNQTYQEIEFIIIDDGSTDGTADILARYEANDSRVRVYRHEQNKGIVAAANRGCQLSRGKYIARMDADDFSLPTRLEKQVTYLEEHPNVGIVGTQVRFIDENGHRERADVRFPQSAGLVKWTLSFYCCLKNSTVMMRRRVLEELGFYNPAFPLGEDYDLFLRAIQTTQVVNLPQVLFKVRMWQQSSTRTQRVKARELSLQIVRSHLERQLGFSPSDEAVMGVFGLINARYPETLEGILATKECVAQLWEVFSTDESLSKAELRSVRLDVGVKLWHLSGLVARHHLRGALDVGLEALKAHPASIIVAGFKAVRRLALMVSRLAVAVLV